MPLKPRPTTAVLLLALIGFALVIWSTPYQPVLASCEYPLFIQTGGLDANVLFIFDNSGSMNEAMFHPDYDPNTNYSGRFSGPTTYYVSSSGSYRPRDFHYGWPTTPAAYLVTSDEGESGRYMGNYLNWIFYHASTAQRGGIPRMTRIQVAKAAVADIINETDGVRFGIMKFNYDTGGTMVANIGTAKATLLTRLYDIGGTAWTPTAESMVTALDYFKQSGSSAPIQAWCQHNFVIVVTDGFPTMDRNLPSYIGDYDHDGLDPGNCASIGAPYDESNKCSHYMDDVALYLHNNDMRPDLDGNQNVVTYTIGFNVDAGLLQETANDGGGLYFNANNPEELANSLTETVADIVTRMSSGTAAAVVSTESASNRQVYRAKFKPGEWQGHLEAFDLPYDESDSPVWDAGVQLQSQSADARNIYTSIDGTSKMEFSVGNVAQLKPYLSTTTIDTATYIVRYIRGTDLSGYRVRGGWKLGDVVDSSPVIVGAPSYFYNFLSYSTFKISNSGRDEVIYVGANDGMLHCIRTADGNEKWAYIPKNQLPNLRELMNRRYCHQFYVNGTSKVVDAYVNGSWRTILIGSEREGGDGYFALDVTVPTPEGFSLLWDVSVPMVNESWGVPEVARSSSLGQFVAFVGSGPDETAREGYLLALSLQNGSTLWSSLLSTSTSTNLVTSPVKVDVDSDGYDDLIYAGDLAGNLWRIDLRTTPWSKTVLFSSSQPIQAKPIPTVTATGNVLLYFGTGRFVEPADLSNTSQQTFYCIIDNHSGTTVTRANLADQTSSIHTLSSTSRGWFIDLVKASGERVSKACVLAAGVVYFTSFQPVSTPCLAGGTSWLYSLDFEDGSAPDNENGTENNTTAGRVKSIGSGIFSEPVFDLPSETIILQNTYAELTSEDAVGVFQHIVVHSWREDFQ
ncbi:MAG: PilC/PilY family type IV pilus protein [Candidatus Eisenbacteria bacterium]|nr:PilC/PilY family type IV pilus protein [Candidatus Eisenbacteria bacterium]